jgi:DNA polymerase-1
MLILDRTSFEAARTVMMDAEIMAVDTETTWIEDFEHTQLMGLAVHCPVRGRVGYEVSFYFPFRHQHNQGLFKEDNIPIEWLRELKPILEDSSIQQVYHNGKFDLEILHREGIEVKHMIWDTMIMSHMCDENVFSHKLESLYQLHFGTDAAKEKKALREITKNLGGWEKVPPQVMDVYACKDALMTWNLYKIFKLRMEQEDQLELYPAEEKFLRCLGEIERNGILIDIEMCCQLSRDAQARLVELQDSLGFDPMKPSQLAHRLYEVPPVGLGLLPVGLSKRTLHAPITLANGKTIKSIPIMDEPNLSRYSDPVVSDVLEYRGLVKAISTWYDKFPPIADTQGRLHANFKQHGTRTSRLSCELPNLQQIPRESLDSAPVKKVFRARPGYELWEFDYSQIEYRLAGVYAEEEAIIEGYRSGVDFHTLTANRMGVDRNSVAKHVNFAISYGSGPNGLVETFWKLGRKVITYDEAKDLIDSFWDNYPKLQQVVKYTEQVARTRKYIKMWDGRRRRFRFPTEAHKGFNSLIQGGAFRIIHQGIRNIHEIPDREFFIVNQVHDSVWAEIPVDNADVCKKQIKDCLEWTGDKFVLEFPTEEKRLWPHDS